MMTVWSGTGLWSALVLRKRLDLSRPPFVSTKENDKLLYIEHIIIILLVGEMSAI
jgi:hypothetical protein